MYKHVFLEPSRFDSEWEMRTIVTTKTWEEYIEFIPHVYHLSTEIVGLMLNSIYDQK